MDDPEIDLKAMVAVLARQRRLIVMTLTIAAGLAFAYLVTAAPIYRATTLIEIDSQGTNLLEPRATEQQQSAILNSRLDSEVEILRSSSTALDVVQAGDLIHAADFGPRLGWLEKAGIALGIDLSRDNLRRHLGLAAAPPQTGEDLVYDTLQRLQSVVTVKRQGMTFLIGITLASPDPNRAALLANLYAKTYIDSAVSGKSQALLSARDVLRRQIDTAQEDLASSEKAVNDFIEVNLARLEHESGDPAVAELRRQLEKVKADEGAMSHRAALVEGAMADQDWSKVAQSLGDAAIQALADQRDDLRRRLQATAEGAPEGLDLARQLDQLDATLAEQTQASLAVLHQDITALTNREAATRDELRSSLLQSDLSAEVLTDLFNLQQAATIARNQYQTLLSREQDMATLANLQIADARIVSKALPPAAPASPNKRLILVLALCGGLGLGTMLGFLREYYIGGVSSASQLQNLMQARVPVTVPQVVDPEGGSVADLVVRAPLSAYAETCRKLRAAIDLGLQDRRADDAGASIILICSALPAEGKTATAISLARTYAQSGARTLLIDADLRKPTVHQCLGVASEVGLLQYLMARPGDEQAVPDLSQDPASDLLVLTAGKRISLPTDQLINSRAFTQLLAMLRPHFDAIVIDSAPLLPVVDTRYLARQADAVLQVVRFVTTTQREARDAAQQLQELMRPDARLYGVLNQEQRSSRRYGYYARYGRYYGYAET